MCDIITKKDVNNDILKMFDKLLKKKISTNPKLIINEITINNKKINVVQENYLIAGTKGRVAQLMLKNILKNNDKDKKIKTVTYRGSFNGFGAIATAYAAYKEGLNCEVFLSKLATNSKVREINNKELYNSRQIISLVGLNSKIHLCKDYGTARDLQYNLTTREIIGKKGEWELINGYYNFDMGLLDKEGIMPKLLGKQLKKAAKNTILENIDPTFWLVCGTSGIAQSLINAFPNCKINILPVGGGKYLKESLNVLKKNKNVVILSNELNKEELRKNRHKYYKSTSGYDDRIWPYIKEYAKDGDFIWNVGADEFEE